MPIIPHIFIVNTQGNPIDSTLAEQSDLSVDAGLEQLLTFPPVQTSAPEIQTGLFDPVVRYTRPAAPGIPSFTIPDTFPPDSYPTLQETYQLRIPSPWVSFFDSGEPDSQLQLRDAENVPVASNKVSSLRFSSAHHGGALSYSDSAILHGDLSYVSDASNWSAFTFSDTEHEPPPPNFSTPHLLQSQSLCVQTDKPMTDYSSTSPTNSWSAYSSPISISSSVTQSPSIYTPSLHPCTPPVLPFHESPSTHQSFPSSPASASAGVDPVSGAQHFDNDGGYSLPMRGPQHARSGRPSYRERHRQYNASLSPSAPSSVRIHDESRSFEVDRQSRHSVVLLDRDSSHRRTSSGPSDSFSPPFSSFTQARAHRGGRLSDSYLSVIPPTHDDSGIVAISKVKMWNLAQDTPTFDGDVDDASDPVSPKKKVASDALVTAATGRRKNEATFRCDIPGCKATFTAKHNLNNHLNSHFGIKSFRCPQCERDFGTPHVLRRHQLICKGHKRFPGPA
ncbi:hypothetical protein J3R30DRAFT_3703905 [Lentinula aciculospora]|uniref:C2H2-type domain-containing protein n=1 Tax=Lentinula aciculospora TaxID=153920 RepID=A0A9W9A972_9AGAR|nr:hypothetical protein J3R30DRAFT_3703905 [Lentinula aciculospora]